MVLPLGVDLLVLPEALKTVVVNEGKGMMRLHRFQILCPCRNIWTRREASNICYSSFIANKGAKRTINNAFVRYSRSSIYLGDLNNDDQI